VVEIDPFFFIIFGGPIVFLLSLIVWVLRKPLLAVVPATADAVRRDLAYRIRAAGYPVDAAKDVLRIKIDSLAALKVHVRANPGGGSQIRYEVDATNTGWALVLILALVGYLGFVAFVIALVIHHTARRFARSRMALLLAQPPPLGTLPPADVRSLLLEGLSEAHRLSSEALDYEREARQNAVGLLLIAAIVLWVVTFFAFGTYWPLPFGNPLATAALLAFAVSATAAMVGILLVYARRSPRLKELERDASWYRAAWMSEVQAVLPSGPPVGRLEFLLQAAIRSPYWREIRRRRKLWHDPVAGLAIFVFAYGAVSLVLFSIVFEFLPIEWRVFLGVFGGLLGAGGSWFVRRWMREVREQDERDRVDWDDRRKAIEAELWRILSG